MTQEQTTHNDTDDTTKSRSDLTHSNFNRSSSDYRSFQVVELDIKRTMEIIEALKERTDGELGDHDSFHVVGYVCSGWENSMYAELEKDAPHMDGEEGDRVQFSHFSAVPSRLSERRELLSVHAPRTIRNTRAAPELKEKQKTTDLDRLRKAQSKLDDAAEWVRHVDSDMEDRIEKLNREVRELESEVEE